MAESALLDFFKIPRSPNCISFFSLISCSSSASLIIAHDKDRKLDEKSLLGSGGTRDGVCDNNSDDDDDDVVGGDVEKEISIRFILSIKVFV